MNFDLIWRDSIFFLPEKPKENGIGEIEIDEERRDRRQMEERDPVT